MSNLPTPDDPAVEAVTTKARETRLLIFLLIILFPVLSVILISAFGFTVWIWQMFTGPPTI